MEDDTKKTTRSGKVSFLNSTMVLIACILYIVLIIATVRTSNQYQLMVSATNNYISCGSDAALVSDGSDYLTEQVRLYVITRQPRYMLEYFREADVTRRRETGLEHLREYIDPDVTSILQQALDHSNQLMETEIYAMRLIGEAENYVPGDYPEEVRAVRLTEADQMLIPSAMIEKARNLVFGSEYQSAKETIMADVTLFLDTAVDITRYNQEESTAELKRIMLIQKVLLTVLLVQSVITFILIVLRSMKKQKENKIFISQIIHSFAKSIDVKDKYTNGHSFRVATYAGMIAKKAGFTPAEVEEVYNIGLLHDIGKIAVPDEILNKPGRLSDEEFTVMKKHTTNGSEILQEIAIAPGLALGAKYHHERIDGHGYPSGRRGDEIPQVAQIIAVADTFDAMYSNRPYRKQMPLEAVIAELKRCSGSQLNPKYVDAWIELISEGALNNVPLDPPQDSPSDSSQSIAPCGSIS